MNLYVIRRRCGWCDAAELQAAAETVCIYEARDPASLIDHANRVGMPADEIVPIVDTVIVRADPAKATAAAE